MEAARLGAQSSSHLYGGGLGELDLNRRENRVFGWDLNDLELGQNPMENSGGALSLRIGGDAVGPETVESGGVNEEERNGKKIKRRITIGGHKVCEMHAKASTAVVGNTVQRFCQQCSRFHLLQEFDEGKRSCRRRLAGHNRRRRKTRPDIALGGTASIEDKVSNYLLLSLLGICANLNSEAAGPSNSKPLFMNGSQYGQASSSAMPVQSKATMVANLEPRACKVKDFDLNDTCDMEGFENGQEDSPTPAFKAADSPNCPSWMQQDSTQSPPQTSGNSDSTSTQSLSSSNGDTQCRTDKIVFKLFEKVPSDLPPVLRSQILGWLSSSPTDIESYIRPGCIILTVYLRLVESAWRELSDDMSSHLKKLLNSSGDNFWASGLVFVMVRHQLAFMYNGQIMLDRPLAPSSHNYCKILCVRPVAAPYSAAVNFRIEGSNLVSASSRLICSFEGRCIFQEDTATITDDAEVEDRETECLSFCCPLPGSRGRGFIEVEDSGFSNSFFPFIIAEQDICSEVSELESIFESSSHEQADVDHVARNQALEFLNELGWLLHRANNISKQDKKEPPLATFNLWRFRNLGIFAMEREWCAVIKMLLDFLFIGLVDVGSQSPEEVVLSENLLHTAVRRKSAQMVRFLLRYKPNKNSEGTRLTNLFRPDALGPSAITPLHIAASTSNAEDVLDALTDDPGLIGISAWKNARDDTGFTPEDYARQRGNDDYLNLVQKKIDKHLSKGHVVLGVPSIITDGVKPGDVSLEICRSMPMAKCHLCSRQALKHPRSAARTFLYRPAMLTMMGVAVVCVCVGILLHTLPKVYAAPTFRWELLERGAM
ncbi:hypothetical protein PR202_gb10381 [Eleusine coracana subsp. coracana]|uniref:SBP-type domain-containing protein n=1 Tax=Eleusine coracana subsp. coracana TaxID=191504 RepID=A0AAV5EHF9_ELECO|nr:hypothetical protein PR202_gb10381 [Eleusine coracana subsp. coracana]